MKTQKETCNHKYKNLYGNFVKCRLTGVYEDMIKVVNENNVTVFLYVEKLTRL